MTVCENAGRRGLIAPFGESNWARNLRIAGTATISFGSDLEEVRVGRHVFEITLLERRPDANPPLK